MITISVNVEACHRPGPCPDRGQVPHDLHSRLDTIAGMLGRLFPAVEAMLRDAEDDLLASPTFR